MIDRLIIKAALQWRAGQLSGQAAQGAGPHHNAGSASMEGRTIVRPGPWTRPAQRRTGSASMEGRTIVRPGLKRGQRPGARFRASMEGRTIVRPGHHVAVSETPTANVLQWRAGQLSGQAGFDQRPFAGAPELQWRAGQLSGQAPRRCPGCCSTTTSFNGGPDNCPARRSPPSSSPPVLRRFNGGPDNCPARHSPQHATRRV